MKEYLGINSIYKESSVIGNKSTAAAIRYELTNMIKIFGKDHVKSKGQNLINELEKWVSGHPAPPYGDISDINAAKAIIKDLGDALNGK